MKAPSFSDASIVSIHNFVRNDDAVALEEKLSSLHPTDPTVWTMLNLRQLVHDAIHARSILVLEFLTRWMVDIDVSNDNGHYPLAAAMRGGEQMIYDVLRTHCKIGSPLPERITASYPMMHGMKEPGVPNYPVYSARTVVNHRNRAVNYTATPEAVLLAVRSELSHVLETPEHPEFLSTQRNSLQHLFDKYAAIDPDDIQRSYKEAFSIEFWTCSKMSDVPITDSPITAIDVCLLRRNYSLVRELVDRGCFTSHLVYPLVAQAIVEHEHYILATLLASGADPNTKLLVTAQGDPLFGHFTIYTTHPEFVAEKRSEADTMSLLALAAKHKNTFAFRELMKFRPDTLKATADLRRFKIQLTSTMSAYLVES